MTTRIAFGTTARARHRRRGMTLIYLLGILIGMCAVGSLATDWGRVQVAKTELRRAADASARYAVTALRRSGNFEQARQRAKDAALDNTVDGTPLVLKDEDISFGVWNDKTGTFTLAAEGSKPRPNAVRITARCTAARNSAIPLAWGSVIGADTCDVSALSTAILKNGYGLVGLKSVKIAGNGGTDSYDPASGAYSIATARSRGNVLSNGDITLTGNGTIKGDAQPGIGAGVFADAHAVTGAITPMTSSLRFPVSVQPPGCINLGQIKLSNKTMTLTGGDYVADSIIISGKGTLHLTGATRLYVLGPFSMTGGEIKTWQSRASNFEIHMLTSADMKLSGQADMYASIYAPLSAVTQSGNADIYGGIIAGSLDFTGSWQGGVHYDESLDWDMGLILTVE